MKKTLLTLMASLLLGGAAVAQHYTAPNAHSKSSNTPIVAAVTVDGAAAATGAELAVYVDDELRGLATTDQLVDGKFWVQVYYDTEKPSDTDPTTNVPNIEDLTFKLWDPTGEGTELTDYTLTYTDNGTTLTALTTSEEGWGTPGNPVVLDFATVQTMETQLAAGWTWWSTPIEMNGNNGLQQLETSLGENGDKIMTQGATLFRRPDGSWIGQITALLNEKCYKINVTDVSTVSMSGVPANPSNHPITINTGWNWIGYPINATQSPDIAFANLQPEQGDMIMRQGATAYFRNGQWLPTTFSLSPGIGYLYNSKATTSKTFVYSTSRSDLPQVMQEESFWVANIHEYENCMAVIAIVYVGKNEQRDESIELAAFVNGKCTGSAKLFYVEDLDRYCSILTVGGNNGDRISFAMVDGTKGTLYKESDNSLVFAENSVIGDIDKPYEIHFNSLGIEETSVQIGMYPNPVNRGEAFRLNIPQEEVVSDVVIINSIGSVVRHDTGALKAMTNGLAVSGVYTIKVTCRSGNSYYGKLVVK